MSGGEPGPGSGNTLSSLPARSYMLVVRQPDRWIFSGDNVLSLSPTSVFLQVTVDGSLLQVNLLPNNTRVELDFDN